MQTTRAIARTNEIATQERGTLPFPYPCEAGPILAAMAQAIKDFPDVRMVIADGHITWENVLLHQAQHIMAVVEAAIAVEMARIAAERERDHQTWIAEWRLTTRNNRIAAMIVIPVLLWIAVNTLR